MKFTLFFVVYHDDGRITEEVVAVGECLKDMPEAFEEMPYGLGFRYVCRSYDGEKVGDIYEKA